MQKKKLLLLSAIVLLGTNSYGTLYPNSKNNNTITKEMLTDTHLNGDTVISITPVRNTDKEIIEYTYGIIDNSVEINAIHEGKNEKKIVNLAKETLTDKASENNGILKGNTNSKGVVTVVAIQGGKFINNGTIGINGTGGKGINITGETVDEAGQIIDIENKGIIEVNNGASGVIVNNDKTSFVNKETGKIIATGTNSKGIEVSKGEATNKGTVEAKDGSIGVYVNGGSLTNSGKIIASGIETDGVRIQSGIFTTDTNSIIEVKGNDKITSKKQEASGVKVNGTSNFVNNGIIKVSGTTDGTYSGYQAKGININSATATAENKGAIIVERNGIGVGTKGTFKNNGGIKVSGSGIGINVIDSGNATNNETIEVDEKSYGIQVSADGTATNEGTIIVKNGSTGITTAKVTGDKTNYTDIINSGTISVSGDSSTGMQANDNRKVINNGDILVNAGKYTSGMKAAGKNALAENNGNLTIIGDKKNTSNGMLAQSSGKVVNGKSGVVTASGKTTSAMSASGKGSVAENNGKIELYDNAIGMKIENGGHGVNNIEGNIKSRGQNIPAMAILTTTTKDKEENITSVIASSGENKGNIILENGAIGIKIDNTVEGREQGIYSVGTNSGTIKGSGKGVTLNGGIFVNSGTIDTTENAIESYSGTNNTVYLKNGSKINGKIVGNTGIDVLALEGKDGEYSNLDISSYEAITVRNGNATISDSTIGLEYNSGTKGYLDTSKSELDKLESSTTMKADNSGKLTMKNSDLIIDFKDSLTNSNATENPIIDAGELHFTGNTSFAFVSSDGRNEFDVNKALGIDKIDTTGMKLETTAVWDYTITDDGKITAKKQDYIDVVTKSELNGFVNVLDDLRSSLGKDFTDVVGKAELLETEEEFTKAMAQMSGGLHGYTVDIAAINSRNLVNTMKNRALTRDYLTARPVNSWYQDVVYLNNNQRLNGLMSGNYQESGVLGVSEKQSLSNGRLGFVYGGSKGKAKFDGGESGEIKNDNIYIGLYYNHDFSEKLALNTNFSFVYGNNTVDRKVKFSDVDYSFSTTYPTYAMGIGTSAIYTIKDDAKNKASFYAGIDVNRIMQGNINEDGDKKDGQANKFAIKSVPADENSYYSITPSAGFMFQNTGYIFDKKYLIGTDLAWETELGNIKDGKRLNMQKGSDNKYTPEYKVGTMQRENVFSTSIFGQLDMTESLALNGRYTSSISDDYDTDMLTLGMTYKMDTMADTPILGPILSGLENTKLSSDRWTGTFALMMESEDDSNRAYYDSMGNLMSGDYATSTKMKPKFTLSLRDKQTKWSYYFEGYYMANDFLKDTKSGEADQRATRLHGEARWSDSYSKGRYGLNIGYRNETSNKPALSAYPEPQRIERGVHQLRLTPNFSYNLGSGFRLDMKTTGIFEYNYTGLLEGQMDFLMENEHYLVYTGFMPRWQLRMGYYREDRWMDHDSKKLQWKNNEVTEVAGAGRYQMNQLRPSATYYIGNGDSVTLALRIPVGNGAWYNEVGTDKKDSESYETRYTVNYNHVVTPGFNIFGELTFLDIKTKPTKESDRKISRSYSFRPTVGFSYSF